MEFLKGDLIEIGVADFEGDEDGYSYYAKVDINSITERQIISLFNRNVIYVKICDDKQSENLAKENLISTLIKE